MLDTSHHIWTLSDGGEDSLGLSCTTDGLFLGCTPLLERRDGRFVVRAQADLERLLSSGYGIDAALDRVMPGLSAVASALNNNDLCRARIAAVHLRLPALPDVFARLEMETEDLLIKLEQRTDALTRADWDPAKHPRAGTAPNPGWFAPAGDGSDVTPMPLAAPVRDSAPTGDATPASDEEHVRLPPGERNDEIGDLLEWIANAKPDDAPAISGEISRLFYQYGDFADGAALHQALIEVLANPDRANRQRILDQLEPITHHDPATGAAVTAEIGVITSLRLPGRAPEISAPATAATEAISDVWKLGWGSRGVKIEQALGKNLGPTFPVIDTFENGVATSIKSIDLTSATYQDTGRLLARINAYSFKLSKFNGAKRGKDFVDGASIESRVLDIAVPKVKLTGEQRAAIEMARAQAKQYGVTLNIIPF
jgi:hypothetical protein